MVVNVSKVACSVVFLSNANLVEYYDGGCDNRQELDRL